MERAAKSNGERCEQGGRMRRLFLGLVGCWIFVLGGSAALASAGGPAGATTVPPTVTASNWTPLPTSPPPNPQGLTVNGIACATSNFCVAVGQQGPTASTLITQWNGSTWALVNGPDPGGLGELQSVSCAGPSFCIAARGAGGGH